MGTGIHLNIAVLFSLSLFRDREVPVFFLFSTNGTCTKKKIVESSGKGETSKKKEHRIPVHCYVTW
jgi:hypothetical protein